MRTPPPSEGASEPENGVRARVPGRAWTFLTLERTARLGVSVTAYADELGVRYVFDSNVPHHADVRVGDLAVIRDAKVVLGAARIDSIHSGTA